MVSINLNDEINLNINKLYKRIHISSLSIEDWPLVVLHLPCYCTTDTDTSDPIISFYYRSDDDKYCRAIFFSVFIYLK